MKVSTSTWRPSSALDTPYRKAQQEWDLRMGTSVIQAMNWRRAAFAMIGVVFFAVVGLIYLGAQPKAEPYVVQIDKIGAPTYIGPLDRTAQAFKATPASIRYHLRRFITDTRSLSSDPAVVKQNWIDAYKLVTPVAGNQLNGWVHDHDPISRVGTERVSIEVVGIMPLSTETWQAEWTETIWDDTGNPRARSFGAEPFGSCSGCLRPKRKSSRTP